MRRVVFLAVGLVAAMSVSSCVKIQSDGTSDESGLNAKYKADQMRSEWKDRIRNATPIEQASLLIDYCDRVIPLYLQVGFQTVDNWSALERQRQQPVNVSEVQTMVDDWQAYNRPFIEAHDENIDFATRQIRFASGFSESFLARLDSLLAFYRKVRSTVLKPSGTLPEYEYALQQLEFEAGDITDVCRRELNAW